MFRTLCFVQVGLLILFTSFSHCGFAQVSGASLTGQVTDGTGAAIPGASVTLNNTGTNLTETAVSDEQGVYKIATASRNLHAHRSGQGFLHLRSTGHYFDRRSFR